MNVQRILLSLIVVTSCFVQTAVIHATALGTTPRGQSPLIDSIPRSVSPRNDSTFNCIPSHITLRWTTGTSFDNSYFVEVATDSTFETLVVNDVVVIDTMDVIAVPNADTTLYWRVRTMFDTTQIWHFNLRLPKPTTIVSPKADTVTANPIGFVWNSLSGSSRYELSIEATAYSRRDTTTDTTLAVTLLGFKKYTWKVRPLCGDGAGAWSSEGHFYLNTETNDVAQSPDQQSPLRVHHDAMSERLVITLHTSAVGDYHYSLINALGRPVRTGMLGSTFTNSISVHNVASGLYILVVENGNAQMNTTLILER